VKARSLACYWANRELGVSLSELARAFAMSIPGVSYAAARGEAMALVNDLKLDE